ncbi:MAG: flippase-like domain-containing protein [Anaerolineae bacterium]|nr:flippase-like domain-containing protein [Anaerolineae bacterium]
MRKRSAGAAYFTQSSAGTSYPRLLIRLALGVFVGGGSLWWTWRGLDWPVVQQNLAQVSPAWIALSSMGVIAVTLMKAARWGALYSLAESRTPFPRLFSVLVTAQMVNLLIPVRLGELTRIGLMKQYGCRTPVTLTTLVIEKFLDLVATAIITVSLASLALAPTWLQASAANVFWIGLVLGAGLILIGWRRKRIGSYLGYLLAPKRLWPERWSRQVLSASQLALETLGALFRWRSLITVAAWTLASWLLSWLTMLALLAAFGLALPPAAAVVLMLAVSVSNIAPSPPALIGVMHGIAVVVLGQFGVTQAEAFAFGLVLNVVVVAPLIILGSAALCFHLVPLFNLLGQRGLTLPLMNRSHR